tara:strand:+ start:315 stop:707 length:393 start_codon:yes stop_codon:yes gene_type:complete
MNFKLKIIMKKYLIFLLTLLSLNTFSQMQSGNYTFTNNENEFNFTISDDGWVITFIEINGSKEILKDGYWRRVNMNGVDEDYNGPEGWYEFQTDQCNYDFDIPINNKLILKRFDCKNSSKNKTIEMTRKR